MRNLLCLVTILSANLCVGQQQPPPQQPSSGARELFYFGTAPKDTLPPSTKPAAPPKSTKAAPPATGSTGALHLGLRYSLLLVGSGDRGQLTDPDHNFRKGDCVAVNLEANRSGYLYVLAKQSSGDWEPLFPTPGATGESNRIDPGQVIRAPRRGCFEIDDPPGSETLFVVLSRNPRDIDELAEGIKSPGERTNAAVNQVAQQFGTRELSYREVVKTAPPSPSPAGQEPGHSVYVVSGSDKPASTLVTKVEIQHR
jgi:hypothetical protein